MNYKQALEIATAASIDLKGHIIDVLSVSQPRDIQGAVELSKIVSKLSPIVGNLIEYAIARHLNQVYDWPSGCLWIRQDPGFPDTILSGMPDIIPGIEVKTWFPLSTEITARFKDSQNFLQNNNIKIIMVCWLLEKVLAGQPKIIDIWVGDALNVAKARDIHYHNPPYYLVIEPEDTRKRTRNLQQTNCNGYIFQGTNEQIALALELMNSWGKGIHEYKPDREYQMLIRQLITRFPYRIDTNFAKMDRIVLPSLETFKTNVLNSIYQDRTIQSWAKAVNSIDSIALLPLIDSSDRGQIF